jgi:hypothetical protein
LKAYIGFAHGGQFKNIDPDGTLSTAGGPSIKQSITTAFGFGMTPRSFVTLTLPYMRNATGHKAKTSLGDPSLAGRYTVVMQSMVEKMIPQVQVLYGYKFGIARSMMESEDLRDSLDVFGTGFSEAKLGLDVWFGMSPFKPGLSQLFTWPVRRTFNGLNYQPGLMSKTTASLGYQWPDLGKVTVGVIRDEKQSGKIAGVEHTLSKQLNHSVFLTADWSLSVSSTIRGSIARQGIEAFGNYNAVRSDTYSLAFMQSF